MRAKKLGILALTLAACGATSAMAATITVPINDGSPGAGVQGVNTFLYQTSGADGGALGTTHQNYYYDQRGATNDCARTMVQFNLPTLPGGAVVTSAKFQMTLYSYGYYDASLNPLPENFAVNEVTTPWVGTQASWNNASTGTPWTTPGGDYTPSGNAVTVIGGYGTAVQWDITSIYNSWVASPSSNNGLELTGPIGVANLTQAQGDTTDGLVTFMGDTYGSANYSGRPALILTYSIVPEPASAMILAVGGMLFGFRRRRA